MRHTYLSSRTHSFCIEAGHTAVQQYCDCTEWCTILDDAIILVIASNNIMWCIITYDLLRSLIRGVVPLATFSADLYGHPHQGIYGDLRC